MKNLSLTLALLLIGIATTAQTIYVPGGTSTGIGNNTTNGNVGIGTATPLSTLHLKSGNTNLQIEKASTNHESAIQFSKAGVINFWVFQDNGSDALKIQATGQSGESDPTPRIEIPFTNKDLYLALSGGNVGIGTSSPDAKLAVKGMVHAQEVLIDLNGAVAPDYVFGDSYKLPSLETIKSYISQHRHLPEVPSAKEMEANGINVREMNLLLLKKIEELTLYVIDLKERSDAQQAELDRLKNPGK